MRKTSTFISLLIVLSSCGQTTNAHLKSADTTVFNEIAQEICNCARAGDTTQQVDNLLNDCWTKVIEKHKSELLSFNIDASTEAGLTTLNDEIITKRFSISCSEIANKALVEERQEENLEKTFKGTFVSENELESGQYQTAVKSVDEREIKFFISNEPFEVIKLNHYNFKDTVTIIYKVVLDTLTNTNINRILSIDGYGDTKIVIEQKQ